MELERLIEKYSIEEIERDLLLIAKMKGYADRQIAHLLGCLESQVFDKKNELSVNRVYKLVDTCAAEFEAQTPYYYSTFEMNKISNGKKIAENESISSDKKENYSFRIWTKTELVKEFDYSCVHGVCVQECGYEPC